jgi:hypothetical protein
MSLPLRLAPTSHPRSPWLTRRLDSVPVHPQRILTVGVPHLVLILMASTTVAAQVTLESPQPVARSTTAIGSDRITDVALGPNGEIAVLHDDGNLQVIVDGVIREYSVNDRRHGKPDLSFAGFQVAISGDSAAILLDPVGGRVVIVALASGRAVHRPIPKLMNRLDDLVVTSDGDLVVAGIAINRSQHGVHWLCRDFTCVAASAAMDQGGSESARLSRIAPGNLVEWRNGIAYAPPYPLVIQITAREGPGLGYETGRPAVMNIECIADTSVVFPKSCS